MEQSTKKNIINEYKKFFIGLPILIITTVLTLFLTGVIDDCRQNAKKNIPEDELIRFALEWPYVHPL